jgi:arylsulfatase A-like enzyme
MGKGVECHELIQNTDFVPTWAELAGVTLPKEYPIDGVSMAPLFTDPGTPIRDYVYCEMGPARSIKTKEWTYIALRYTKEQIQAVRSGQRRIDKRLLGLSGGVSRGALKRDAFNEDQLYHVAEDPAETRDLSGDSKYREKLDEMKRLLTAELKRFAGRPFGEFIPGGNAVPAGSFDDVLGFLRKAAKEAKGAKKKK